MDSNYIASLKDYNKLIEDAFKKIDRMYRDYEILDYSSKARERMKMESELKNIKLNNTLMKKEHSQLKEEKNQTDWEKVIESNKKKYNEYKEKIDRLNQENNNEQLNEADIYNPDKKVNKNKLTTQQVMGRGDKILDTDDQLVDGMIKQVNADIDLAKQVNVQLKHQSEQEDIALKDLEEMDYSLKRARKQLATILRQYATDKLIICLIVVMLLIIVGIIIVGCLKGKKGNDDKDEGQTDIFK